MPLMTLEMAETSHHDATKSRAIQLQLHIKLGTASRIKLSCTGGYDTRKDSIHPLQSQALFFSMEACINFSRKLLKPLCTEEID